MKVVSNQMGQIPDNWEIKKLKEVGSCIRGLTYSPEDITDQGLLVLRSSNIHDGMISLKDNVFVNKNVDKKFITREGDILICVRNGSKALLGKSAIIPSNIPYATHGAFMTIFRSTISTYVRYLFESDYFYRQVSRDIGATINSINNSNLLNYSFPIPPIYEQKNITEILSAVDKVIELLKIRIEKLEFLKQSIFDNLLSNLKDDFEIKSIGQVTKLSQGIQVGVEKHLTKFDNSKIRFLRISDYTKHDEIPRFINKELATQGIVTEEDIIMIRYGEAGRVCKGLEGVIANNLFKITPAKILNKRFLFFLLSSSSIQKEIQKIGASSAMPAINFSSLKNIKLKIPSKDEQNQIANIMLNNEKLIYNSQKKFRKISLLRKSLLEDLLQGNKRIKL